MEYTPWQATIVIEQGFSESSLQRLAKQQLMNFCGSRDNAHAYVCISWMHSSYLDSSGICEAIIDCLDKKSGRTKGRYTHTYKDTLNSTYTHTHTHYAVVNNRLGLHALTK